VRGLTFRNDCAFDRHASAKARHLWLRLSIISSSDITQHPREAALFP
jgi:hypothetical protein